MRCSLGGPSRPVSEVFYWLGEASQDGGDLAHDFRIAAVLELARGERPVGIRAHDHESLLKSATTAEIAAVAGEKNVERPFPECCLSRGGGLPDSPMNGHKLRVAKPGMDGVWVSADPEHVGGGKVWDTRQFAQGPSEETGAIPASAEGEESQNPFCLSISRPSHFAPLALRLLCGIERAMSLSGMVGPTFFQSKVTDTKKFREARGVEDAQGDYFLNRARRRGKRLIIRERARGGEVARVVKLVRNPARNLRCFPEGEARADSRSPEQLLEVHFVIVSGKSLTALRSAHRELRDRSVAVRERAQLGIDDTQNPQVSSEGETTFGLQPEAAVSGTRPCRCRERTNGEQAKPMSCSTRKIRASWESLAGQASTSRGIHTDDAPRPHVRERKSLLLADPRIEEARVVARNEVLEAFGLSGRQELS